MKKNLINLWRTLYLGCLASLLLVTPAGAEVKVLDRIAAIVNNDVVMQSQLERRLNEVMRTIRQRGTETPPMDILRQQVLERLILESLQLQLAERSGIRVSDEQLNRTMANIAQRNNMTLAQFRRALSRDGLDPNSAREQIRREMLITRVRQRQVSERIQISDQDIRNFLSSDLGKLQLSEEYHLANILIAIPEAASATEIQRAEALAQDTYQQLQEGASFSRLAVSRSASENALEGGDMGWRKSPQLPPPFNTMIPKLPVGGFTEPVRTPPGYIILKVLGKRGGTTQLQAEVNVRHILIKPSAIRTDEEARLLAERLYERIMSGEDFAELARNFSEDPGSALNGGELGWTPPEALVPEFSDMMENTPSGEFSTPFQTPFGWHILQVLGRRATDTSDEFRRQQALTLLRNRRFDEELQTWLRQIRDEAYVEIK